MADLAAVTERVTRTVGLDSGLDAVVKFEFAPEGGVLRIDGKTIPNHVGNEDDPSDITIKVSLANFVKIIDGELNPKVAMMTGRLRLRGDIRIAFRLDKVFGLPSSE